MKSGLVDAEFDLGYVYRHGEGVPQDPALDRYWFRQVADRAKRNRPRHRPNWKSPRTTEHGYNSSSYSEG